MYRSPALALIILFTLACPATFAEVRYANNDGFYLELIREVQASPSESYAQFMRIGEWWNSDHTWFGDASNLSMVPEAGGCFCERSGDKSALHMLVTFVDPGKAVHMVGGLGPLQGLALHGAMVWQFDALPNGGTRITHSYRVMGYYPDGLKSLADVVDQVQRSQLDSLQTRLVKNPGD